MMINGLISLNQFSLRLLSLLPMTVVKSAVMFTVVFALTYVSKKIHLKSKYILWIVVIASLIILPVFSTLVVSFNFGIARAIKNEQIYETFTKLSVLRSGDLQVAGASRSATVMPSDKTMYKTQVVLYWPCMGLCVWVLGILVSSSTLFAGAACLAGIRKSARPIDGKKYGSMLKELSRKMGIRGDISLLQSDMCKVPFTYGVFRHFLLLPSNLSDWPSERVRAVLSHELIHAKRRSAEWRQSSSPLSTNSFITRLLKTSVNFAASLLGM